MDLNLNIEEAQAQLAEKSERVAQIRAKLAEMQVLAMGSAKRENRNTEALALAVLDGGDVAQALEQTRPAIEVPTISPTEARRVVSGLEAVLAQALDEEQQARSAVRRAAMQELKDKLQRERQEYDRKANELHLAWARVAVLAGKVGGMTGVNVLPLTWGQIRVPRGIEPLNRSPYDNFSFYPEGEGLITGGVGNVARAQIAAELKAKGVEA